MNWMPCLKRFEKPVKITVELSGQLLSDRPRRQSLEVEQASTAGSVATELGLPEGEIGLVVINGVQAELEDPLPPDCRLCFFPYLFGG
jgi:hypothetical protein